VEKIKTHILYSVIFFYRTVYEVMWKNSVESERPQMTLWRLRITCWIPKTTNTHTFLEYVILIALPLQQWSHEHISILFYMYIHRLH